MILAIVGSRSFDDYQLLRRETLAVIAKYGACERIVSGGANGADTLARRYAVEHDIPFVEYAAEWAKYGKRAGPMRNARIVEECTHVLAFPLGASPGTRDTISQAARAGKIVIVANLQ